MLEGLILRKNRHVERDQEVTVKFKDGGQSFLDEIQANDHELIHPQLSKQEEEKRNENKMHEKIDIILFLIR